LSRQCYQPIYWPRRMFTTLLITPPRPSGCATLRLM